MEGRRDRTQESCPPLAVGGGPQGSIYGSATLVRDVRPRNSSPSWLDVSMFAKL